VSRRGVFVVLEGLDGCGKSTQAALLVARLQGLGREVLHVREPGSTLLGERVRSLLLDRSLGEISPLAEVLLYQAARAQLVGEVLQPALTSGRDVVCERWHYATSAYQGVASGAGLEAVRATSAIATQGLEPDRAVLLDLADEASRGRIGRPLDRMRSVDAAGTPQEVEARVWGAVRDLF
jgi:dTMP kinase